MIIPLWNKEDVQRRLRIGRTVAPICESTSCPFRAECANHGSAGEFREEDGLSPTFIVRDDCSIICDQRPTGHGIVTIKKGE